MTDDDKFFERLRADARALRHQPDEQTLARIRERIHDRLAPRVTVVELLAAWFRPLAMTALAIALAAGIGVVTLDRNDVAFGDEAVEVSVEGETFRVAD
ncbi:MAG TPA: hypothetical protein VE974_26295 [Thermoanaerobaculia bacterium]|nr:hypothetical protein [Thermoanaerobaculia bacterium]